MAQKNLLKYILLGLITEKPKTGYDLKKELIPKSGNSGPLSTVRFI